MKKLLLMLTAVATLSLISCAGGEAQASGESGENASASGETTGVDAFPWDFPQDIKIDAEVGQMVLAPYTYYPIALEEKEDLTKKGLIFYNTTMEEVGKTNSALGSKKDRIPNALIIPLDKDVDAHVGDLLLTWWQSGSGLKRAIVTDASDPRQPKVNYLDLSWEPMSNGKSFGEDHANEQLKPNSFNIIKDGEWAPGAQLAVRDNGKWLACTLIREKDGKVLVLGFADKVCAYKKDDCKLIPFKESINVGDKVFVRFVSGYDDGYTVTKADPKKGIYTCKDEHGKEKIYSKLDVTKAL